jgi:hypothetical protein
MKSFPDLPVEEEGRLGDSLLRENFIQRVNVLQHIQGYLKQQPYPAEMSLQNDI